MLPAPDPFYEKVALECPRDLHGIEHAHHYAHLKAFPNGRLHCVFVGRTPPIETLEVLRYATATQRALWECLHQRGELHNQGK